MIKYHPDGELLHQFAEGLLPASMSAAVSIHIDMCKQCREKVTSLQQALAQQCFAAQEKSASQMAGFEHMDFDLSTTDMAGLIDSITSDDGLDEGHNENEIVFDVGPTKYRAHRALKSMSVDKSVTLGKISRAKIDLGEGPLHTHLLYMAPGGEVPQHTHTGFEVTLLLEGRFVDDMGEYGPGDFIILDDANVHSPYTPDGCLCLTVVSDALKFTSGIGRLLNPIGKYLY